MPKVADTPEVTNLPGETPYAQMTAPRLNIVDYSEQFKVVDRGLRAASRAKAEKDTADARAKIQDAVNMYAQRATFSLTSEGGALTRQGSQVLGKDKKGRNFMLGVSEDLTKIENYCRDEAGLTPEEAEEYRRRLVPLNKDYWSRTASHYATQHRQWQVNVYNNQGAQAALNITHGGSVTDNLRAIEDATRRAYAVQGLPINNELIHEQAQQKASAGVLQHLQTLVAMGDEEGASVYLAKTSTQKALTPEFKIATNNYVQSALQTKATKLSADNAVWQYSQEQTQAGKFTTAVIQNGALPEAYVKQADVLGNLTPEQYDALDPRRKAEYQRKSVEAVVSRYGGNVELAMLEVTLVQDGKTPEEAQALLKERVDKATNGLASYEFTDTLSTEGKGRYTRMLNRYKTDVSKDSAPTYEELYKIVQANSPFASPEELQARTALAMTKATEYRQMQDAQNSASISAMVNNIRNGGDITDYKTDPAYSNLQPSERAALDQWVSRYQSGAYDKVGDAELFSELLYQPGKLARLTDGQFLLLGAQLDSQQMMILERQREAMKQGVKMGGAPDLNEAQKYIYTHWELFDDGKIDRNSKEGKEKMGYLLNMVEPRLRQLQAVGKTTTKDVEDAVQDVLRGSYSSVGGGIIKLAEMKEVKPTTRNAIANMLDVSPEALKGQQGVLAMSRVLLDPSVRLDTGKIPLDVRQQIIDTYREATGKVPNDHILAVLYIYQCQTDKLNLDKLGVVSLINPPAIPSTYEYIQAPFTGSTPGMYGADENGFLTDVAYDDTYEYSDY